MDQGSRFRKAVNLKATSGQRAAVKVTSSSITNTKISILTPNGSVAGWGNVTSTGFVDTQLLPMSGTHAVVVDPNASYTGSITFTLYVSNDVTGSISAGGAAVTVTTTTPGQNGRYLFSGTADQRVSLKITGVSLSGGTNYCTVSIKKPDGTTLTDVFFYNNTFIDTQVLPTTGTYTILVDPSNSTAGSVTLTLYDVPADYNAGVVSATVGGFGVGHLVVMLTAGQNGFLTIEGTTGQRLSLNLSGVTLSGGSNYFYVYIRKPDGTTLTSGFFAGANYMDIFTLPVDGTYYVLVDPADSSAGNLTVTVNDVPADTTGTITAGGSAVTVTNASPGQNGTLTFSGTANQRVSIKIAGVSFTGGSFCTVYLKKPDGSTLGSVFFNATSFIDVQTLPSTGTYTILVDPKDAAVGSVTVTLYDVPADLSGSVTVGGSAENVAPSVPGQNATLTFDGTSSQQVTVRITNNTLSCVTVTLSQPNGSTLTSTTSCSASFNLSMQTLPTTGTYTIKVDPSGANTGSLNVSVTNP